MQMDANSKTAMHFISLIRECRELALTVCEASECQRRSAEITWEHGQRDLSEWNEQKGDVLYQ